MPAYLAHKNFDETPFRGASRYRGPTASMVAGQRTLNRFGECIAVAKYELHSHGVMKVRLPDAPVHHQKKGAHCFVEPKGPPKDPPKDLPIKIDPITGRPSVIRVPKTAGPQAAYNAIKETMEVRRTLEVAETLAVTLAFLGVLYYI